MIPRTMQVWIREEGKKGKIYTRVLGYESLTTWLTQNFPGQRLKVATSYRPGQWSRVYTQYTKSPTTDNK